MPKIHMLQKEQIIDFFKKNDKLVLFVEENSFPVILPFEIAQLVMSSVERENMSFDMLDTDLKGLSKRDKLFIYKKLREELEK